MNKPFKDYYSQERKNWIDLPNPIFIKCGNRQKTFVQRNCRLVSSLNKISAIKESLKHSFINTGIYNPTIGFEEDEEIKEV